MNKMIEISKDGNSINAYLATTIIIGALLFAIFVSFTVASVYGCTDITLLEDYYYFVVIWNFTSRDDPNVILSHTQNFKIHITLGDELAKVMANLHTYNIKDEIENHPSLYDMSDAGNDSPVSRNTENIV